MSVRRFSLMLASASVLTASLLQAQSLADAARRSHERSRSAEKVYTNDNLPTDGVISVIGIEAPTAPDHAAELASDSTSKNVATASTDSVSTEQKPGDDSTVAASEGKAESSTSTGSQHKAELKKDAAELKANISMLEREIDVSNREFRLRAATFYADAGNSLRNPKQWADQQRDHEAEVKEKQAALDAAKQKLADLQEQARREGITLE